MRLVPRAVPLLLLCRLWCPAAGPATVVLQFERAYSPVALGEMRQEAAFILKQAGVDLQWRYREEVSPSESFSNLIVLKFKGACDMTSRPVRPAAEPAALGYTYVAAGKPLPFSDIECDRIRGSLGAAEGLPGFSSNLVLGQALGRVVAHELHHILDQSCEHSRAGWMRKSLSPADLTAAGGRHTD